MQKKAAAPGGGARSSKGSSSSAASRPKARGEFLDKTAEQHAVSGPMSVGNFMMPGSRGGAESSTARPSSRGMREPTAGARPVSRGGRELAVAGERPGTRSGREQVESVEQDGALEGRPGTRNGRAAATESVMASSGWGDMFAADDSETRKGNRKAEGRPSSRQGGGPRAAAVSGAGKASSRPTQSSMDNTRAGEGTSKPSSMRDTDPSKQGVNSDEEIERLLSGTGDSGSEKEDPDFEQFLRTGESRVLEVKTERRKKKAPQLTVEAQGGRPESRSGRKQREKKPRSEEEKEAKRAEIIDHCLERMVRDAEKEVSENSAAYYDIAIYRKKSLKEATAALGVVLDAAWATIDLEMKLAAIEQLELASQADADVWLKEKLEGHDWQYRMRQEMQREGVSMDADFAALPPKDLLVPVQRIARDSDDEVDDETVLRMMPPMQDPLDALVAAKMDARGNTLPPAHRSPGERMSIEKLAARAGHKSQSSMAHHGLRRLRD